ncbi:MAG TPA: DMT family transporter [Polyangiaceae bacterium LLY-WYZ-15_(1-7)]|nr:hypothetical protein [Myxococcales bacterium]HJK90895.1 DMT family transporter [Polyangiaceae bacterium LLY-WYZ-15_(1-7)]HJL05934.1 DMT family transporter [Polyangiaceae bacterium LLY-WYZ-15_(1-7)]HJL11590.1 DMT family transporter [Polyangiaceae bacterium LLY-WYZ-15_(1-7)]HJL22319.1 DMT family transporter [Polyangiaceae bacterium LLY-WYZ-15_(1-7)]
MSDARPDAPPGAAPRVHLALVAVQLAFGTLPVVGKLVMEELAPFALAWVRVLGGAVFFGGLWLARRGEARVPFADVLRIAGCGLLGMAANQVLFLGGLERTTAINASVLVTTIPVFAFLVALITRAERLGPRSGLGLALAFAGVLSLVGVEELTLGGRSALGDLMIVINAFCYGAYLVLVRPFVGRHGSLATVAIGFGAAAIAVAPFGAPHVASAGEAGATTWLLVAYILAVPTALTYLLNAWALKHAPSSTVAIYIYLQPVVGVLFAVAVLGEALEPRAVASSAAVLAGIGLVITRRRRALP